MTTKTYCKWWVEQSGPTYCSFTNNVRLATQTGHVRACAYAKAPAAHHHCNQTTTPARGSFVYVVSGARACRRQRVGRVHSKAQSSSSSTPSTYVNKPKPSLESNITNPPNPRETQQAVSLLACTPTPQKKHYHHHNQTTRPASNRLFSAVPAFATAAVASNPCRPSSIEHSTVFLLRRTIVARTYDVRKNLYITLLFLTMFGPDYYIRSPVIRENLKTLSKTKI